MPLQDFFWLNPNFLKERSSSSPSLDSYSSGRTLSYTWEVSVVKLLRGPFASIGMLATDVDVPELDPTLSGGFLRSDPEEAPGTHYINPTFCDVNKLLRKFFSSSTAIR